MPQDYHIYIHNENGVSSKQTAPKSMGTTTKPKGTTTSANQYINKASSFLSNPDSVMGEVKGAGISALGKAGIVGAIIYAAVKVSTSVTNKATDLYSITTGDYSGYKQWEDFKATLQATFTPVNTIINYYKYNINLSRANERARIRQQLLGDSQINQNYNRKV